MPTPEDLCIKLADGADDEIERTMLLKLAEQWRRLANHKQKLAARQEPEISN